MNQRSIFSLVSVCSVSLLALAVGCAAPTAGDEEGTTTQDLSSSASGAAGAAGSGPSTGAGGTSSGGGVTDPLCVEHHIHNNTCIFDWELRAEALTICGTRHLDSFTIDAACAVPSTGGDPTKPTSAAGAVDVTDEVIRIDPQPSATKVSFACCNAVIDPPVSPGLKATAAAL